jgi:hypothetical protein
MAAKKGFVKMKPIPKENLDELIRLTKKYWRTGDVDILPAERYAGDKLSLSIRGDVYASSAFRNIVNAMFSGFGLKPNATYQDVYDVFALFGYEVVSEPEGSEDEPV